MENSQVCSILGFCVGDNTKRNGTSMNMAQPGLRVSECNTLCSKRSDCVSWNYEKTSRMCTWLSSLGEETQDLGYNSGFKATTC